MFDAGRGQEPGAGEKRRDEVGNQWKTTLET
jgi:hypothetical protein